MNKGAPFRLHHIMSRTRFDGIIGSIWYNNKEVQYQDGFFHMLQLEEAWNQNMADQFFPSWINGLDEYMMECYNKWAPGFMCVIHKPHLFVNQLHTIAYDINTIIWRAHIVGVKDRPAQLGANKWYELGKTVGIMLQMCEPIFGTGKAVVLDSGFSVENRITAL